VIILSVSEAMPDVYDTTTTASIIISSSSSITTTVSPDHVNVTVIVVSVIAAVAAVILIIIVGCWCRRRSRKSQSSQEIRKSCPTNSLAVYSVSQKNPPCGFLKFFRKPMGIFLIIFTVTPLLYVPV